MSRFTRKYQETFFVGNFIIYKKGLLTFSRKTPHFQDNSIFVSRSPSTLHYSSHNDHCTPPWTLTLSAPLKQTSQLNYHLFPQSPSNTPMLCPKVWDLKAPQHHNEIANWSKPEVPSTISNHYYNHSVSVVVPLQKVLPKDIIDTIVVDSDYYKVEGLPLYQLVDKQFIEAFVKNGELTLLSINTRIDLDNCICITPKGQLVLSLTGEDYQRLGIEGKRSFFDKTRYVVQIDLTEASFTPGKKNYERVQKCLKNNLDQLFDVIFAWEAPEITLCPSSAAKWFHELGYKVKLCQLRYSEMVGIECRIPSVGPDCDDKAFIEWLGILSIGGDVKNEDPENYVNSYVAPCPIAPRGDILYTEWRGFLTRKRLEKIYKKLENYVNPSNPSLWHSLHVQGFSDSPVSWSHKEHSFFTDGDNNYTIVFNSGGDKTIHKSLSSNNAPRKKL